MTSREQPDKMAGSHLPPSREGVVALVGESYRIAEMLAALPPDEPAAINNRAAAALAHRLGECTETLLGCYDLVAQWSREPKNQHHGRRLLRRLERVGRPQSDHAE